MHVLVTGATGFIGRAVCQGLLGADYRVTAAVRESSSNVPHGCESIVVGDINGATAWGDALAGVEAVVHLAARTHVPDGLDAIAAYRRINVDGSAQLFRAAVAASVDSFVYMSSIKVSGECSSIDASGMPRRFSGDDDPKPTSDYGRSKWDAECALREIARETQTRLVVLRPPLVYGPGQKANLRRLMRAVAKGVPLPFAGLNNRRSFIDVRNLAEAVVLAVAADCEARGTYTLADVDLSTEELVCAMATALNTRARLFRFPLRWLKAMAWLIRHRSQLNKITGSLIVESDRIANALGWVPQHAFAESMREAAVEFRAARRK